MARRAPIRDWTARKFGRLRPIRLVEGPTECSGRWLCRCDCGAQKVVSAGKLRDMKIKSCGCLRREVTSALRRSHGCTSVSGVTKWTPEYRAWISMKTRCADYPDRPDYALYFARGIRVCERWLNSFQNFLSDVGPRPSDTHSLDRIDVDGNYEPSNVRWATRSEQAFNTRRSKSYKARRVTGGGA